MEKNSAKRYVLIKIFKNIKYLFVDSTILNDEKHQNMLIKWIEETEEIPKQETKLIYKGTRDSFESYKFHEHCDNKLNAILLIKANNFIFGGFTSISWHIEGKYGDWKDDPKSFIFSISNPSNQPIKFKYNNNGFSIYSSNHFGPIFGRDIFISNNSNQNEESYSNLGYSFEGCTFKNGTKESKEFLCGSFKFKVQEIEVFQLF